MCVVGSCLEQMIESCNNRTGNVNSTEDILSWICELNKTTHVHIGEKSLEKNDFWFYDADAGEVRNRKHAFFSIKAIRKTLPDGAATEQPIIVQPEIGYLGIIVKEIDGELNFLMQAKIEPGNVNCVQISPTIQATKSNFLQVHGGKAPAYLEWFRNAKPEQIVFDQIESEQSSRFYKKRNRNIIIVINEEIDVLPNFMWMTLGQIKELMKIDNLVNMDTRTVLSGIPLMAYGLSDDERKRMISMFMHPDFGRSACEVSPLEDLPKLYNRINDCKMFNDGVTTVIPLSQLTGWTINARGISCDTRADFDVRFYDIEIAGREVQHWTQPLFRASGMATFALLTTVENGVRRYLVSFKSEIGSFDQMELGPSVQWEPTHTSEQDDGVDEVVRRHILTGQGIMHGVVLSEEGGRFYHEQNYNYVIDIDVDELPSTMVNHTWVSYSTLNYLVQINNCLNIQLRNLLSLIDW